MAFVTLGCRPARAYPGIRGISGSGSVKGLPILAKRVRAADSCHVTSDFLFQLENIIIEFFLLLVLILTL